MCPLAGGACTRVCDRWMPPSSCSGYALTHIASSTSLRVVQTPWLIDICGGGEGGVIKRRGSAAADTLVTSFQRRSQIQTCALRKLVCLAWHHLGSYNEVIAGLEVSGGPSGGVPIPPSSGTLESWNYKQQTHKLVTQSWIRTDNYRRLHILSILTPL